MSDIHPFWGLPRNHYGLIMVDFPWEQKTYSPKGLLGRPQHYKRMTVPQLKKLPIMELGKKDHFLMMWTTSPHLANAFKIAEAMGYTYSSKAFVWAKLLKSAQKNPKLFYDTTNDLHMGQGYTTRKNAEDCLLFRKGNPVRANKGVRELIISPLGEHSEKPDEAFLRAEQFANGPYLDMFSRKDHTGWSTWGDEQGKLNVGGDGK